jgi:multisubunit Na+/H+ antiporter MnhB subunit
MSAEIFDYMLAAMLILLAWSLLSTPRLFKAIVVFIVFGLLMALAWGRLLAPDIALAEAAIGAGLTGVLLLSALGRMDSKDRERAERAAPGPKGTGAMPFSYVPYWVSSISPAAKRAVTGASCLVVLFALAWAGVLLLPERASGLLPLVQADIARSGAANPVTAVLLNFRSYDTLLEIGVLLLALFGVWSMPRVEFEPDAPQQPFAGSVLIGLVCLIVPVMILVSGYLLWIGSKAPGGAFQGGAVLAAAWVLLMLSGWQPPVWFRGWPLRAVQIAGFALFLVIGAALLMGGNLLEYPLRWAGSLILVIEAALLVSISAILASLFSGRLEEPSEKPR